MSDAAVPSAPGAAGEVAAGPPPIPLTEPREGTPAPVGSPRALQDAANRLAAGSGPIAVDVERASAYRYSSRAYLVQLRRAGSGTFLIDPVPFDGLAALQEPLSGGEWVLHAASQDLPSLAGEGLRPATLFDTELAGRLLGRPRVSLGAMVAEILGYELEKGHSAADWSKRPLPEPWLRYAALDVELLIELRDALEEQLQAQGKWKWAQEEFSALAAAAPPSPRAEPWRRTSGMHRHRRGRQLAVVRELWHERDRIARERDTAPGRVLSDAVMSEAALNPPRNRTELLALPAFATARAGRRHVDHWLAAVARALALPADALPSAAEPPSGPPPPRTWAERDPAAAQRLAAAREAMAGLAERHQMPVENLLSPDTVRRLVWAPPQVLDEATVAAQLRDSGAREWQVSLTAPSLTDVLRSASQAALEPPDKDA